MIKFDERANECWLQARLAVTLRYLATGNDYNSAMFGFRVANNTICRIVPDTCKAIVEVLHDEYFKCPTTKEEWLEVAKGFEKRWNFPHCLGAMASTAG